MVVKSPPVREFETAAELHAQLGYVPLDRICITPPPGTATEADVMRLAAAENKRLFELVDATLVEKSMGTGEAFLGAELLRLVSNFVVEHRLGIVIGGDGPFRFSTGNVRYPDLSFIPFDRLPNEGLPGDAIWSVVPALVVEILSPSNTIPEIDRKLREYFASGCNLAWVIDPVTRSAEVYQSANRRKIIQRDGTLDGGKVLPSFALPLSQLFADPLRPKPRKKA